MFSHSAFVYADDDAYAATLGRFLRDGLAREETVAVAAAPDRITMLRDSLGGDARSVRFLSAEEWLLRPVRTIATWANLLRGEPDGQRRRARMLSHLPYDGPPATWVRFEAAVNSSLAGLDGHLVCAYDRRVLPADLVAAAGLTHPRVHDGSWRESEGYRRPERLLAEIPEPAWPVSGEPVLARTIPESVGTLRAEVRERAEAEGWLPAQRVDCLLLALSEIATNGIRHGGSRREVRIWVTGEAVICEVTDDGEIPMGPLAGYVVPTPGMVGGMGLWLVQQLCDSLAIHRHDGLTRVRFALVREDAPAPGPQP